MKSWFRLSFEFFLLCVMGAFLLLMMLGFELLQKGAP